MDLFGETTDAKPFIKWAGGKRQLIPEINKLLPTNINNASNLTYVEPFIGGGAFMFWFLQRYPNVKRAVINDINTDLTTAYQVVKDEPLFLIAELAVLQRQYYALPDEESKRLFYNEMREIFNSRTGNPVKQAALLIFINKTCFNGLYRVNSINKFNVPFGKYAQPLICDKDTIITNSQLLKRVQVYNTDFCNVANYVSGQGIFYFDPPYKPISQTSSFNSYSADSFGDAAQERLASLCRTLSKQGHLWILSNSDVKNTNPENNYFEKLYEGFFIRRIKARRSINSKGDSRGEINELLVTNFVPDSQTWLQNSNLQAQTV
jgi:DNA adenine methylase